MTSTIDSSPVGARPSPAPRRHSAGHIIALVAGCLLLLPGIGLAVGGGALAIGQAVATDDDGYFQFTIDRIESDGVAVATTDLWFDDVDGDTPWLFDWLDVDVRFRVDGAGPTDEVFVGIARATDVERYLADASWSELIEIDDRTPSYREVDGTLVVAPPAEQDFWTASVEGSGEQELIWEARGGRWSVVVMNVDGTAEVAADVEIGARSGAVTPIAVTLLIVAGLVIAGAVVLIVIGARGRRVPGTPPAPDWPTGSGPAPTAPSADDAAVGHAADAPLPPPAPIRASGIDDDAAADDAMRARDQLRVPHPAGRD